MTTKEAVKLTGKSEYWLRNHVCPWCDCTALTAVKHGCMTVYPQDGKCDPMKRFKIEGE